MPAIATHYIFVNDLISKDDKYHDLISLAGQGPDPFFFYGFSFSKRHNTLNAMPTNKNKYFSVFKSLLN